VTCYAVILAAEPATEPDFRLCIRIMTGVF
jgi:hypothetical protein